MRALLAALMICTAFGASCETGGGSVYCCSYESRHTSCGGGGWNDWESETFTFDMDNYLDSWTPERVCNQFTGSDTSCGGSCCINIEYRNTILTKGSCD